MQQDEQQWTSREGSAGQPADQTPAPGQGPGQEPGQERAAKKTSTGLDENVAGLLCYVLGWITGIIFLVLEKENRFVRFHAFQSIIVFGGLTVLNWVFAFVPLIGWLFNALSAPLGFVLWIILMVKAYQGQYYKIPYVGDIAEKQVESFKV